MKRLSTEIYETLSFILSLIPGVVGKTLRTLFYRFYLNELGKNFSMGVLGRIQRPHAVSVGENVGINDRVWIAANEKGGQISIGDDTIIGPNCVIHSGNHVYHSLEVPIRKQGYKFKPIKIGSNVWIAANVTILSGVEISDGVVVAAGSVVTRDVEENVVIGGVPAKVLKMRT